MKKGLFLAAAVLSAGMLFAEESALKANHVPAVGSVSLGFTFNPASLASQLKVQPKTGEMASTFIANTVQTKNLFMLAQDPVAALRVKYRAAEHLGIRASLGFSGSYIDYAEYVKDDLGALLNPLGETKVADHVSGNFNSTNFAFGLEYTIGKGNVHFVAGMNLLYAFGGNHLYAKYGNEMTLANVAPTTMPMLDAVGGVLNEFTAAQGISWARPTERYTAGFNHGVGFQVDAGIEWFCMDHLSVGVAATFTPVMFAFQPQTWAKYEGVSAITNSVMEYNAMLSPGSWAVLYGTQNIGAQLSLNYYF